jgi:hypothetical protein
MTNAEPFNSCRDCSEFTIALNENTKAIVDHCEQHNRHFSKSFPIRDRPCCDILECQEIDCPVCGEIATLIYGRKEYYYECSKHGRLSNDYQSVVSSSTKKEAKE